jgi:thiamine biosynthesis lipoprotein
MLSGCQRAPSPDYFEGDAMGTTYHVTVTALPQAVSRSAVQAVIDDELANVDRHLSTYRPDSEISRFNASGGTDWLPASGSLYAVLAEAQRVSGESGGAFDVTVAPLVSLWGFGEEGPESPREPTTAEIGAVLATVGFSKLGLRQNPRAVRKLAPGLHVDVAGIAPGYAVDRIAERLVSLGIQDCIVEIGGEVRAWGRSPEQRPWRVAVEVPVAGERRPYTLVDLDGMSISTSGDYRDYRFVGTRRISHTIDPRRGTPVRNDLASVTVLHTSTMSADANATALMVLGPEEGFRYAERHHLAVLFIERVAGSDDWRERVTPEFSRLRRPLP